LKQWPAKGLGRKYTKRKRQRCHNTDTVSAQRIDRKSGPGGKLDAWSGQRYAALIDPVVMLRPGNGLATRRLEPVALQMSAYDPKPTSTNRESIAKGLAVPDCFLVFLWRSGKFNKRVVDC